MIAEFGHFLLILALFSAITQAVIPLYGAHVKDYSMALTGRQASICQFILVGGSFCCLTYLYINSDFSVLNVVQNSHTDKPLIYKISGVWGNHEGSLLLWVLILALFGAALAVFGKNLPPFFHAKVLSIQALIGIGFYLLIILTSNPFERVLHPPLNGNDLNPLLQDPGLAFHPPMLYLGYVGFSIAFSFAIAALLDGEVNSSWARWVRPWTLAAWSFLTGGIALGSWWAYYELGWGGWWFWDPVENASFMPWLTGTALLHSAIVVEKRETLKGWTVLLAIIAFSMSLLGTFLVRSGVLTSVHAFATDPTRGVFILGLLTLVIGGSLTLFALRGPQLKNLGVFKPISREGALLLNNLLIVTAMTTILLGTLYPLFLEVIQEKKISVGPPFFNYVFIPMMIPTIIAMGIGPYLNWKRSDFTAALLRLRVVFFLSIIAAFLTWHYQTDGPFIGVIGIALSVWLGGAAIAEVAERISLFKSSLLKSIQRLIRIPRATWGMTLGHFGLAITIAGITGAGAWKVESIQTMEPGEKVNVAGYIFTFLGSDTGNGPNYKFVRGKFQVHKSNSLIANLNAEKRKYNVSGTSTTEAAIHTTFAGDLYAVIGEKEGSSGAYVTRLYFNPLVVWMWIGAAVMMLGGGLSVTDFRYRVGLSDKKRNKYKISKIQFEKAGT